MYCKLACKYMGFFILLRSEATERAKGTRGSALYVAVRSEATERAKGTRGSALYEEYFLKKNDTPSCNQTIEPL